FRAFAQAYNARIVQEKQFVHLLGFPPDVLREKDAKAHIHCADLFVPSVFRTSKNDDDRKSLADLLKAESSVLVLGDPGMGKTMLLTFLALLHAEGAASLPEYTPPPKRIPIFVSLREYALEDQKHDLSLLDYLAKRMARFSELRHAHPAFFEASLLMGEAIVLLDGLDEVGTSTARRRMADRVRELRREYPDCPIWVTSRIHGYTHDIALPHEEFEHVRIGALDDAQVDDFLARWYQIQVPDDIDKREDQKRSLREAIFRTKQVRALATNPLLLTLMAFVHRFLGHLPQDRGELYEQCVNMLLRSWLEARERPEKHAFECLGLASELPRGYLEALAFHVQEQSLRTDDETTDARGLFGRDDALSSLTTLHVENDRRDPPISPLKARDEMREFLDYACDRVGLLVDRGGGKLSFLHLSFQEYLAAAFGTVMTNIRDQERVFVDHFREPGWSEVLLLRLYLFARKRDRAGLTIFDELVRVMLDELGRDDAVTGWQLLGRALRDRHDVRASQRRVILERLVRAWACEPAFEGDLFVGLEDIRIFATDIVQGELRGACAQVQANGLPKEAVAALYLEETLFGGVVGAAQRFSKRPDVVNVLADLVAFYDVPEFAALLAEKSTAEHWETALGALPTETVYRLTLGWATGAILCRVRSDAPLLGATRWLRRKINAEVESRERFAAKYHDHHNAILFQRPGTLAISSEFRAAKIPLAYATVKPVAIELSAPVLESTVICANLMWLRWRAQLAAEIIRV
ncbi:MAG TPA: NACHT domain-containing protein, partial [Polyangium sp.]|nr:NACHT domain-containing protein [Polyangium sp.]